MIVCYAQPDKDKSKRVLRAFADGCGASMASTTAGHLASGDAVFYGVRADWAHLWAQAKREGRTWYYIDNSYFDCVREQQFRVTRGAVQHDGAGVSDGTRFAALNIQIKPYAVRGPLVVVCPPSDEFMHVVGADPGWLKRTVSRLIGEHGASNVVVRWKFGKRPLMADLENAKLLVTWGSAAAVTATLEGIPVEVSHQSCARHIVDRLQWARVLADNQWTLSEFQNGTAWRMLNDTRMVQDAGATGRPDAGRTDGRVAVGD